MSRRAQSIPPEFSEKPPRSRCLKIICVSWKVLTCIISHVALVSLVVGYCLGGAYLFQYLELEHEKDVKKSIKAKRLNVTDYVWEMTENVEVLKENDWIENVEARLLDFEHEILIAMRTEGWDGDENVETVQWTFEGSLFYSIIVITTIGYGHIAPRTQYGKVTTIFYAILGIPLMLLCLSNIGDVMASSFRFLYWRVCCFVCTREPKRKRNRFSSSRSRQSVRQTRSQPPSSAALRRSIRTSQRSADSGFVTGYDHPGGLYHAYSDPDIRYSNFQAPLRGNSNNDLFSNRNRDRNEFNDNYDSPRQQQTNRNQQQSRFSNRSRNRERMRDRHTVERERNLTRRPHEDSTDDLHVQPPPQVPTAKRAQSTRSMRASSVGRDINRIYSQTLPSPPTHNRSRSHPNTPSKIRAKSVDARATSVAPYDDVDDEVARKTPILCNRYAIDELDRKQLSVRNSRNDQRHHKRHSLGEPQNSSRLERRHSGSPRNRDVNYMPQQRHQQQHQQLSYQQQHYGRYGNQLDIPNRCLPSPGGSELNRNRYSDRDRERDFHNNSRYQRNNNIRGGDGDYDDDYFDDEFDDGFEMQPIRKDRRSRRAAAAQSSMPPSPRIMSPMGFAIHRQAKIRPFLDDDSYYDDEIDSYGNLSPDNRPVPIWLCVFLVVSYIIAGAFIFRSQEGWSFLDATYFCFITLTTIGFGDFVPSTNNDNNPRTSIALCSLYLLFGISLLAMSFNLVQEEVIANVKEVARRLGILKEQEPLDD